MSRFHCWRWGFVLPIGPEFRKGVTRLSVGCWPTERWRPLIWDTFPGSAYCPGGILTIDCCPFKIVWVRKPLWRDGDDSNGTVEF